MRRQRARWAYRVSTAWINWFGFVTIPFLALLAFFLITVFSVVALFADEPQRREEQSRSVAGRGRNAVAACWPSSPSWP